MVNFWISGADKPQRSEEDLVKMFLFSVTMMISALSSGVIAPKNLTLKLAPIPPSHWFPFSGTLVVYCGRYFALPQGSTSTVDFVTEAMQSQPNVHHAKRRMIVPIVDEQTERQPTAFLQKDGKWIIRISSDELRTASPCMPLPPNPEDQGRS